MKHMYLEKSLGIDIRDESVSLTALGSQMRNIDIIGSRFFKIKPLIKGDEQAEMSFLEEINRFMMQHDLTPNNVAISLPRSKISLQSMELPAPDRNVIDSMIGFELEKHFSSKPEDLYFTYHVSELPENRFHVVLSAVKKETADYYLQLVERLGLKVTAMDASTLSNYNLIPKDQIKNQIIAVADLCSNAFDISIIKNGNIEISRNIPIKNHVASASYFLIDLPAENHQTLAYELGKEIIDEIISTLSCCDRIGKDENIERIFILGGGPYAKNLKIGERSGTPATTIDLPHGLHAPLAWEYDLAYSASSLALALRELRRSAIETNLLPTAQSPKKKRVNIKTAVGMLIAAVLLLIGLIAGKTTYKKNALASIDKQLQELKVKAAPLEKVDLDYDAIKQYLDILNAIKKLSPQKLPVLEELTRILPKNTWLTEISIIKDKVEIKGISATASALIPLLENSPHFKDAGFNGSVAKTSEGEKFVIRFIVKDKK